MSMSLNLQHITHRQPGKGRQLAGGLYLLALATAVNLLTAAPALADVTEEKQFSHPIAAGGRIHLENINGEVRVTGGSSDTVEIHVLKRAENQEALDRLEVVITANADSIRIETRHPESEGWFNRGKSNGSVDYTLEVPANVKLDGIGSVNGDIYIAGVSGDVRTDTVNGDIEIRDLQADASFDTVNGSIEAHFLSLEGSQRVKGDTVNGRIELYLPGSSSATVELETVNGRIDADDFGLKVNKGFIGRDLSGTIGDGDADISLDTVNGSISLRLAQ